MRKRRPVAPIRGEEPGGNTHENEYELRQGGGVAASKKLLAAIAVLAVAFAVFAAIPAIADDSDAATGTTYYVGGTGASDVNNDGKSAEKPFATIDKALKATDVSKIVLKDNIKELVTVADGKTVTLDLNGYTLTNPEGTSNTSQKGVVLNNGTLTIMDSSKDGNGTVNAVNKMVAIANTGVLTIDGGNFTNTATTGEEPYANYILNNNGVVEINDGTFKVDSKTQTNSSVIKNGWYQVYESTDTTVNSNDVIANPTGKTAEMTIKGGSFTSWTYVKNDTYGEMVIEDGTFTVLDKSGKAGNCVYNAGELTVKGGTFDNTATQKAGAPFLVGTGVTGHNTKTDIQAGTFNLNKKYNGQENPSSPLIVISGATESPGDMSITVSSSVISGIGSHPVAITDLYKEDGKDCSKVGQVELSVAGSSVSVSGFGDIADGNKPTFTYADGKLVVDQLNMGTGNSYVSGKVQIDELSLTGTLVVSKNADVTLPEETAGANIVNLGGTIKSNDGKVIDATKEVVEVGNDPADLERALLNAKKIKLTADVILSNDIVIPEGVYLDGGYQSLILGTHKVTVNGTITYIGFKFSKDDSNGWNVGVGQNKEVSGSFTVTATASSATIVADKIGGTLTVLNATISGKITSDLEIVKKQNKDATIVFGNTTVNSGVTLTLPGDASIADVEKTAFNLYGSLATPKDNKTVFKVTVPEKASFKAYSGSQIAGTILVTGTGSIDLSQAQNPQSVGEDISYDKIYGQLENVTIVDSLTIKNNSTVTVKGGFNVNEGVTLTIEKGSTLIIDSEAASMIVAGKIVVEDGAYLTVTNAKDVQVSGSIESEGTVSIASTVTIKSGGSIVINDNSVTENNKTTYKSTFSATQGLTVEAGAELIIKSLVVSTMNNGQAVPTVVTNKGTVTLDGAVLGGDFTVNMAADKAVVQVLNVQATGADRTVTITDAGLKFTTDKSVDGKYRTGNTVEISVKVASTNTDKTTIAGYAVKGLTVVETVSSETVDGQTEYYNTLDLAGTVSVASTTDNVSVTGTKDVISVLGDRITVTGELTLGKNVNLTVTGKISVSGKLVATEENSKVTSNVNEKEDFTVSGLVQTIAKIDKISAAMYETKSGTTTLYNYTTLKAAVDAAAKDITVTGTIYVTESFTVPSGTTVKGDGQIVIGSAENTDVELTFADGAVAKTVRFDVDGTLYFENNKTGNKASEIISDVTVIGEKDARYTNVYTALAKANAGDTVTVTGETVDLKKNITIKEGVTLDVPNSKKLVVYAGVTVTVNGTLKTAEKIETEQYTVGTETKNVAFALEASKLEHKAAIIVNGVFMSGVQFFYASDAENAVVYMIPGAYYHLTDSVGDYYYATTLETASKSAATIVDVYGKVTAGDVAFAGTDSSKKTVTVKADADLTAASITLDKATFVIETGRFTGDVKAGESAVTVKNVTGMTVSVVDDVYTVDGAASAANEDKNETASFAVSAGSVYIKTASMAVKVASGATLVSGNGTEIDGKLTIEGTAAVANDQTITVDGDVVVKGTLTVAAATDSKGAGTFNANGKLYIGITDSDLHDKKVTLDTGDAASVTGAVTGVKVAFVKADATVSEATIDSFKVNGVLKSTTYIVEDKDWITAYAVNGNENINYVNIAPVENAEFKYWQNTDGDVVKDNVQIGASKCDKVTAFVDYEIYTILVNPAAGIESIAIDGNLMQFGYFSSGVDDTHIQTQMYYIIVKAGTHDITCKLANGYSGEAKFAIVDSLTSEDLDASVSGNKVTVSGDAGSVTIQITGISASGYVQPTEPAQDDKDDGLSLTDILLIILVVLIVVMAIIVALRLMRS